MSNLFELLPYLLWRAVHSYLSRQARVVIDRAEPAVYLGLGDLWTFVHRNVHPLGDGESSRVAPGNLQRRP
jgi:hypothetical protein